MSLNHERKENQGTNPEKAIPTPRILLPSQELAWIIGTLSGKGTVNTKIGQISIGVINKSVQEEFIKKGKQVFGVDIPYGQVWTSYHGERITHSAPSFFSTRIARALGELSRTEFPETIENQHAWILQDKQYTFPYVEGLFEARGNVYNRSAGASKDIIFQTSFPHVADFIADVLEKIDVTPNIIRQRMGSQLRTRGVTISTLPEQKKFAELVHSKDPKKESQLEEFRQASTEGIQTRVKSKDELIDEWKKMTETLGHAPNMYEISTLYKEGKTKWSYHTYTYWFGKTEKSKKFSVARRQLISIVNPELAQERINKLAKHHQRVAGVNKRQLRHLAFVREQEQRKIELDQSMAPSRELAWVLGLIVAAGYINLKNGSIILRSSNLHLQDKYTQIAGHLFRTNLSWSTGHTKKGEYKMPQYNNAEVARRIGGFRRPTWPDIIAEKNNWIMKDRSYIWALLSGIFDDKGVFTGTNKAQIVIPTSFRKVANFIAELMASVGIKNPLVVKSNDPVHKEGVQGVAITNIRDLKKFADNIHSVVPEKEQKLESIRNDARKPRSQAPLDENILIAEWQRMYKILGHFPNVTDIAEWYTEGKTNWSAGVYARVFGPTGTNKGRSYETALRKLAVASGLESPTQESIKYRHPEQKYTIIKDATGLVPQYRRLREMTLRDKGRLPGTGEFNKARRTGIIDYSRVTFANYFGNGSLVKAISKLEELIFIEDVNDQLVDYEDRTGFQVRYILKAHPSFNPELRERLDEILHHPPTSREIGQLRRIGETRFYPGIYADRFGKGSFIKATTYFDINAALRQYEKEYGIQVKFVHKVHRINNEDEKRRLEELLNLHT